MPLYSTSSLPKCNILLVVFINGGRTGACPPEIMEILDSTPSLNHSFAPLEFPKCACCASRHRTLDTYAILKIIRIIAEAKPIMVSFAPFVTLG